MQIISKNKKVYYLAYEDLPEELIDSIKKGGFKVTELSVSENKDKKPIDKKSKGGLF